MCIICNLNVPDGFDEAQTFLHEYEQAQQRMKTAAAALLDVMQFVPDPARRKQYDRMHKRMRRLAREWNRIEHDREDVE